MVKAGQTTANFKLIHTEDAISKMKKIGLTLGKYAPLHKGHQWLFETALQEVDELIVLIYKTSVMSVPLNIRAQWIRDLYPQITVIEAWDGPEGYANNREYEIKEEQYILKMLNGRKVTHFYSSEAYGAHVSHALHAVDRRVDESRQRMPISATMIRENPYQHRNMLSPNVYRDLITKVVFLGAMSTGKSTLTEALAKKFNTTFAPEYGREYWEKHQIDRRIGFEDFNLIADGHIAYEDQAILEANRYFFVDTNAITTAMYCMDYHQHLPKHLERIALENAQRYDLFFLCEDDIPYDDTWDRSGPQKRAVFHQQIIADLKKRKIPYIPLTGTVEQRIEKVEAVLRDFNCFDNYYGQRILNP